MKRLTNEEVKVDASVDGMIGPLVDLTNMKPKLLDMILNGPTLNGVSKDTLRSIIRQLYSALAACEDTGLEPEEVDKLTNASHKEVYFLREVTAMRLIDADTAAAFAGNCGATFVAKRLRDSNAFPEVVTRCKGCKHLVAANVNGKGIPTCRVSGMEVAPDEFCSRGEKGRR